MASNGLPLKIDYAVADIPPVDILFVWVGLTTEFPGKSKVLAALRSWGRRGGKLGALSVGSYLLAEAGQLDGYRCTIHWENRAGFMERFPEIDCTGNVFEIDRKRYTCAGGTTSIDLMLEIVRARFRPEPRQCRRQPVPARAHPLGRRPPARRPGARPHRQVGEAAQDRRADGRQSRRAAIRRSSSPSRPGCRCARSSGCSCAISAMTPGRYYMRLRLERARELLRQTNMPILDVAIATGFTSHSYFAQSYRLQFGRPPSEERRTTY